MCLGVGENSSQMQAIVKKDDPLIEHAHISCTAYVEMFVMDKLYYFWLVPKFKNHICYVN